MEGIVRKRPPEEGESYFMSMTDMMVGLLFVFIILLAYFAFNLQAKTEELAGANKTRAEILRSLQNSLKAEGLQVEIDTQTGVLRLPDEVLFDKARWKLNEKGQVAVAKVARAMVEVLPCYTTSPLCKEERSQHLIDAVFVEGHTDSDPMLGAMDNYELSARRAKETFDVLKKNQSALNDFRNSKSAPILSLSGYGPDRSIAEGDSEEAKKRNRRIDLRFLMVSPGEGLDPDILRRSQ
jgi:chemotaxis protein MotB